MAQPTRNELDVAIVALSVTASDMDGESETYEAMHRYFPKMSTGEFLKALRAVRIYLEGWSEYGRG